MIEELNVAYLEMPYSVEDSAISMIVYLPIEKTPTALDDVLSKFTVETIHEALTAGSIQEVDVEFPKISLDGSYVLAKVSEMFNNFFFLKIKISSNFFLFFSLSRLWMI